MQGSASAATLSGPGLAGLVAQAFGVITALLLNAASFLVSAICLLAIRTSVPRPSGTSRRQTIRADIAEGVRFVTSDPYLRPMSLFGGVANFGLSANQALAVVFLVRTIEVGPLAVGLLLAVPGVSGLLGALTARRLTGRVGTARGLLLSALAALPFGLLIPLTQPGRGLVFYVAGTLIAATGTATASIIMVSFRQAYSPPLMRGRVSSESIRLRPCHIRATRLGLLRLAAVTHEQRPGPPEHTSVLLTAAQSYRPSELVLTAASRGIKSWCA